MFLERRRENKKLRRERLQAFPELNLLISSGMQYNLLLFFPST